MLCSRYLAVSKYLKNKDHYWQAQVISLFDVLKQHQYSQQCNTKYFSLFLQALANFINILTDWSTYFTLSSSVVGNGGGKDLECSELFLSDSNHIRVAQSYE